MTNFKCFLPRGFPSISLSFLCVLLIFGGITITAFSHTILTWVQSSYLPIHCFCSMAWSRWFKTSLPRSTKCNRRFIQSGVAKSWGIFASKTNITPQTSQQHIWQWNWWEAQLVIILKFSNNSLMFFTVFTANRPFARWRLFTTKTRIHFVSSFIFKFVNPIEV